MSHFSSSATLQKDGGEVKQRLEGSAGRAGSNSSEQLQETGRTGLSQIGDLYLDGYLASVTFRGLMSL